ncbi:MAG: hypothetical protein RR055_01665 [Oscillospiraceae bacterium]
MSYCKRCGAYVPDGDDSCPACGTMTDAAEAKTSASSSASAARAEEPKKKNDGEYHYSYNYANSAAREEKHEKHSGSAQWEAEYDSDVRDNKSLGYLCYLGFLLLIPLLTRPNSQFLKYHCNQGLALSLFCILAWVCSFIPVIGWAAELAGYSIGIVCLIKGLTNVSRGKRAPLPIIGDIKILK